MEPDLSHTLVPMIRNDECLYVGNLIPYFRTLFFHAQNLRNPYHNFRHMLHVTRLCYEGYKFYLTEPVTLPPDIVGFGSYSSQRNMRSLLIAAMFHDFDHSGQFGNDDLNIDRAIRGIRKYIQPEDLEVLPAIEWLIRATEYPHTCPSNELTLGAQILRDADVSQALDIAWIQQVIFGLADEWHKAPLDVLRMQGPFHKNLNFSTRWAKTRFANQLPEKITEAQALLEMLEVGPLS